MHNVNEKFAFFIINFKMFKFNNKQQIHLF